MAKVLERQLQHQTYQCIFRVDIFGLTGTLYNISDTYFELLVGHINMSIRFYIFKKRILYEIYFSCHPILIKSIELVQPITHLSHRVLLIP